MTFIKQVEGKVYKLQGNEFRITPFKFKKIKACDGINADPYFYKQAIAHSTVPEGCPVPAGNYTVDWCPDLSRVPPNFLANIKLKS